VNLSVKTSVLTWLGIVSVAAAFAVSFVVSGGWVEIVLVWGLFGALGITLMLMSASIETTGDTIAVRRFFSTAEIRWSDIAGASVGGGNLVLYTASGRLSMPSSEFWSGPQRDSLKALIAEKLDAVGVSISRTARAAMHSDNRSPNKSLERTRGR
jgi:Bacterial PH domain